jgi:enoyl-CoA hydratase
MNATHDYSTLLVESREETLYCTFNRPDRRNAVDDVMHQELVRFFQSVGADEETRVLVLTGAGAAFCAGGDIGHMDDQFDKHDEAHPGLFRDGANLFDAIMRVRQPIIAQVNGDAIGLGASLAVLSDMVYMGASARIGDPHVKAGLVPGDGGLIAWPLLLPLNLAKELLFTGRILSADEAGGLGIANRVVADDELAGEVEALAGKLAAVPQHALQFTKRVLNKILEERATYAVDLGLAFEAVTLGTADHQAAVSKFVARSRDST